MTHEQIDAKLRAMLTEVKDGLDYSATSVDTTFGDAGLDSLDSSSLLLLVQEEFDVEISDEDADRLDTIAKLRDYLAGFSPGAAS